MTQVGEAENVVGKGKYVDHLIKPDFKKSRKHYKKGFRHFLFFLQCFQT